MFIIVVIIIQSYLFSNQKKNVDTAKIFKAEEMKKGDVSWSTYFKYFSSGTNIFGCLVLLLLLVGAQVGNILLH